MIVTIDGPGGSGKSTVARELARRLGWEYLDTGAMYRTVTWKAMEEGVDLDRDPDAIVDVARRIRIDFHSHPDGPRVLCDGRDVTGMIRRPDVTRRIRCVADVPEVREALVNLQRRYARRCRSGVVTEGRDQGSVVFPDAAFKFYLDADVETRAERRLNDFRRQGIACERDEVVHDIRQRDQVDRERPVGGLRCTDAMIVIDSSGLKIDDVVRRMVGYITASAPALSDG